MPWPYVFTFYSYKGGVGRSMALLNVAYKLAGYGRHVLIVDMDLEAPGISSFLTRNGELAASSGSPLDILALLSDAIRLGRNAESVDAAAQQLPPLSNFIQSVAAEKLEALKPKMGLVGRLDVLGVDQSRDFTSRLATLDLKHLRQEELAQVSRVMHRYFAIQRFEHRPLGVEEFQPAISTPYDYVLVDSRTGITEIGGLCVGPLADRLVVVTGLNDQNVNGTIDFLREVGIETKPRSVDDEKWDASDPVVLLEQPSLGPKPTIVVASPVPTGEISFKRDRLAKLAESLGVKPVSLSYHPQLALMESIFVRDYDEEYLTADYKRLATHVMSQVGDSAQQLAAQATRLANELKDADGAAASILKFAPQAPELAVPLLDAFHQATKPEGTLRTRIWAHIAMVPEHRPDALSNWGNALSEQAQRKSGAEADAFFDLASAKYAEAVRLKPDDADAFFNWATTLYHQAEQKSGAEADAFFDLASAKYAEAVRLKPDYAEAFSNWGTALHHQAKRKSGTEADAFFDLASAKYAEAVRLKKDDAGPLLNWGSALSAQARMHTGEKAQEVFRLARQRLTEAGTRGLYNLACLDAIQGNIVSALQHLRDAVESGQHLSRSQIVQDRDFDSIRNTAEFKEFLASLPES